jgi:chemotaxis protein methyltransferase CheR
MLSLSEQERLGTVVEMRTGVRLPADRLPTVVDWAAQQLQGGQFNSADDCIQFVATASLESPLLQSLVSCVTIGESYFFRDEHQFEALRNVIVPALTSPSRGLFHRRLTILSAGCSSGEEPYSLAMLLRQAFVPQQGWEVRIIGADINTAALRRAQEAVYGEWSFRGVDPIIKERFFTPHGRKWRLRDEIRQMVRFQYVNLLDPLPFGDVDLVLWRNVSIYFSHQVKKAMCDEFHRALRPDGWLVVGASELSQDHFAQFELVVTGQTMVYRKSAGPAASPLPARGRKSPLHPARYRPAESVTHARYRPAESLPSPAHGSPARVEPAPSAAAAHITPPTCTYEEAELMWEKGEIERAERMLAELTAGEPRALYLLAKIAADSGELDMAERHASTYLEHRPDCAKGHYLLALIFEARGSHEQAASEHQRALFLDSNFVLAYWCLGLLYKKLGRTKVAYRHLNEARKRLRTMPAEVQLAHSEGQTAGRMLTATEQALAALESERR